MLEKSLAIIENFKLVIKPIGKNSKVIGSNSVYVNV